jgi:hypothetical protein
MIHREDSRSPRLEKMALVQDVVRRKSEYVLLLALLWIMYSFNQCTPAQHKSSVGGMPQISTDNLSSSSRIPRDDELTIYENNGNNGKKIIGEETMGLESCVKAAKEYLRLAQSHVEQFAHFVESWESAQKHSAGSPYSNGPASTPDSGGFTMTGGSPHSSHSSSTIVGRGDIVDSDSQADRTDEVNNFLSDLGRGTYVYKDQNLVSPTSAISIKSDKIALGTKDHNRPLRPKSNLVFKAIHQSSGEKIQVSVAKSRRLRLRGENEPWSALAPRETSQHPRRTQTSTYKKSDDENLNRRNSHSKTSEHTLLSHIDDSPVTPSRRSNPPISIVEDVFPKFSGIEFLGSFNDNFEQPCSSMHLPMATTTTTAESTNSHHQGDSFEGLKFSDDVDDHDNKIEFNPGFGFNQDVIQGFDDPFISPLITSYPSIPFELILDFNQAPLAQLPTVEAAVRTPHQGPILNSNGNSGSLSGDACIRTVFSSLRTPSFGSTPLSSMSQGDVPITPQDPGCTPTRKSSGRWQRIGMFGSEDQALEFANNWLFEDLDSVM